MKKTDWGLALATAAYSYIFYRQNAGINFLLFTALIVLIQGWTNRLLLSNRKWLLLAALTLASGVFVFVHGSWLSLLANLTLLLVLGGFSMKPSSSVFTSLVSAGASIAGSPAFVAETIYRRSSSRVPAEKFYFRNMLVYLIPLLVTILFFVLYRLANPLFAEFTKAINLDFVTMNWLLFTFTGLLACYGIVRSRRFASLDGFEDRQVLSSQSLKPQWDEARAAVILFIMLDAMLFFMNGLDVHYLYLGAGLPEGITHKQFVHKGVGNLILSIVIGIGVVAYFFRGELNFTSNRVLRFLVYLWIALNLFMVLSTVIRNQMYIAEALLTYKRIGVFFWTALAAAGLLTTIFKIHAKKPFWYLVRSNSMFALVVLAGAGAIDWDKLITDYNVQRIGQVKELDKRYLIHLSETNIKTLYEMREKEGFENNIWYHYEFSRRYTNGEALDRKLARYLGGMQDSDWRSFSLRKKRVLQDIAELNKKKQIRTLDLSHQGESDLSAFFLADNAEKIILDDDFRITEKSAAQLAHFRNLQTLEMATLTYPDLVHLVKLRHLPNLRLGSLDGTALAFLRKNMPETDVIVQKPIVRHEGGTASRH